MCDLHGLKILGRQKADRNTLKTLFLNPVIFFHPSMFVFTRQSTIDLIALRSLPNDLLEARK